MPLGTLGKYERLDVLGHGVSGIVYLAKDTLLNKQVALKEVDVQAGDVRRFLEEARVMDRLRHPNIVRVNNVDRIDGKIVIDMEYVRGQNLQDILRAEGPLAAERAIGIAAQVLDALDYAHGMQTVHRDVKPANILIGRDGSVKLVDFGLAEILATNAYAGGAGTYAYMAPEDFAEEERSDNQSDIWAVGVMLFEMLTGCRPFNVARAKDPFSWKRAVETQPPAPLSEYLPGAPAGLQAILDRALARDKRARYATAGAFRDDLLRLSAGEALAPLTSRIGADTDGWRERESGRTGEQGNRGTGEQGSGRTGERENERTGVPASLAMDGIPRVPVSRGPDGPGVVVADVGATVSGAPQERKRPFGRRKAAARLDIHPESIDFGPVRKGEVRSAKLVARVTGAGGRIAGRVLYAPGWLTVHPTAFESPRQKITVTAHTDRVWETGHFEEKLRVETSAGAVETVVHLTVLKARRTFAEVALWWTPLLAMSLLPVVAAAYARHGMGGPPLELPGAAASAGLALMLLLVSIAADLGVAERTACGVSAGAMAFVIGTHAAQWIRHPTSGWLLTGLERAGQLSAALAVVLLLQVFYAGRWKLWACVLLCLSAVIGSAFFRAFGG